MQARNSILLIMSLLVCGASLNAQDTLVVSDRVGKVIDAEECRYFGLFPAIDRCDGVAFLRDGDSVTITQGNERLQTVPRDLFTQLGVYIDEYDSLRWSLRENANLLVLNQRFELLQDALLAAPVEERNSTEVKLDIRDMKNLQVDELEGELIWAGEKKIILLPDGALTMAQCVGVPVGDIKAVTLYTGHSGALGAFIGGLIGGFAGFALSQTTPNGSASYRGDNPGYVATATLTGAAACAVVGALIGAADTGREYFKLENQNDYLSILPELRTRMYYRYGLPPEMR